MAIAFFLSPLFPQHQPMTLIRPAASLLPWFLLYVTSLVEAPVALLLQKLDPWFVSNSWAL
jgi:hypothetical protein